MIAQPLTGARSASFVNLHLCALWGQAQQKWTEKETRHATNALAEGFFSISIVSGVHGYLKDSWSDQQPKKHQEHQIHR